jgi:glycosyltransferase involved in cell wall biosynthesis
MEDIKISVIVPAYNVENYIQRTLDSIINQTFKYFELIVVNDGSTDDTLKIIREKLLKSNINYQIIDKNNEGVSIARNTGMKAAQGDYIFFLDGDDFIAEDCLDNMYQALLKNDCQSAYASYLKISENGPELDIIPRIKLPETSSSEFLIKLEAMMTITFSFCQLLYSTSVLRDNNLSFNPEIEYGEDTEFALRFLAHINRIAYVEEDLIFYLQRENSSTSKALFKRYDFIKALDGIKKYYQTYGLSENIIKLIDTYRIPKSIWGNTIFLLDSGLPYKEVLIELKRRKLMDRLNSFKVISKNDYLFLAKIKIFTFSPGFYYYIRKLIKK